jgi:hypothetical protein
MSAPFSVQVYQVATNRERDEIKYMVGGKLRSAADNGTVSEEDADAFAKVLGYKNIDEVPVRGGRRRPALPTRRRRNPYGG